MPHPLLLYFDPTQEEGKKYSNKDAFEHALDDAGRLIRLRADGEISGDVEEQLEQLRARRPYVYETVGVVSCFRPHPFLQESSSTSLLSEASDHLNAKSSSIASSDSDTTENAHISSSEGEEDNAE